MVVAFALGKVKACFLLSFTKILGYWKKIFLPDCPLDSDNAISIGVSHSIIKLIKIYINPVVGILLLLVLSGSSWSLSSVLLLLLRILLLLLRCSLSEVLLVVVSRIVLSLLILHLIKVLLLRWVLTLSHSHSLPPLHLVALVFHLHALYIQITINI
jgi:hypothetical protein